MDEEVTKILLNGMPLAEFKAYYLASLMGALLWFIIKTWRGVYADPSTPSTFSWRYFWRGLIKYGISVIALAWAVVYFSDYGPFLLKIFFQFPEVNPEALDNVVMNMNAGSAFLLGFFVDFGIRKITHKIFKKMLP